MTITLRKVGAGLALTAAAALVLTGCTANAIGPVTVSVNDLQGKTVELPMNQQLNVNTDSLAVDSYTAEIEDESIVEFIQGKDDGSAKFNPGFKPLKVGTTEVTMTNEQGGIQPLQFTIEVVEVPAGANLGGAGR